MHVECVQRRVGHVDLNQLLAIFMSSMPCVCGHLYLFFAPVRTPCVRCAQVIILKVRQRSKHTHNRTPPTTKETTKTEPEKPKKRLIQSFDLYIGVKIQSVTLGIDAHIRVAFPSFALRLMVPSAQCPPSVPLQHWPQSSLKFAIVWNDCKWLQTVFHGLKALPQQAQVLPFVKEANSQYSLSLCRWSRCSTSLFEVGES